MMSKQFESMKEGLTQALDYVKGDTTKGRSRVVEAKGLKVQPLNTYSKEQLKDIRLKNNMTLKTFAECLGVSQKTVESWERGKNKPSGASLRLFQLLEENSSILEQHGILVKIS
jgi:putative transcriptional regulator